MFNFGNWDEQCAVAELNSFRPADKEQDSLRRRISQRRRCFCGTNAAAEGMKRFDLRKKKRRMPLNKQPKGQVVSLSGLGWLKL